MQDKPNILFIFSDQQHWQAVSYQDDSFDTPVHDQLAAEGVVFNQAFCTTPQCSPSRSSMLTGLYPSKTGVMGNIGAAGGNHLKIPTIGAALQKAGYHTAYFGKWHLGRNPVGTAGWNESCNITDGQKVNDEETTRRALSFLDTAGENNKPFALFLSYNNPHDIYHFGRENNPQPKEAPALPETWNRKNLAAVPAVQQQFMVEDQGKVIYGKNRDAWLRYREIYREKVKLYDDNLGKVLAAARNRGLLDSALTVVTSDHGDMDGELGLIYKGPFMYEQMMRVPLIVRLPGGEHGGRRVDWPTVNVDLVPTLAEFAGIKVGEADGQSLAGVLTEGEIPKARDFIVGQYYSKQQWVNPIRMIRTEKYKYNLYQTHGEELYDLKSDPMELNNVADDAKYAQVKSELAGKLEQWVVENDDPFHSQQPTTREGQPL